MQLKTILTTFTAAMAFNAMALTTPVYIWDNEDGFKDASKCKIEKTHEHPFRVSRYYGSNSASQSENLRRYNGVRQSNLPNGSLIMLEEGKKKANYKFIKVLGVNETVNISDTWKSNRKDTGYLFHKSILPLDDYIYRFDKKSPNLSVGDDLDQLQGNFLRLVTEGFFYKVRCKEQSKNRSYYLFKVYEAKNDIPTALVGISPDETEVLRSIVPYTKMQVYNQLPIIIDEVKIDKIVDNAMLDGGEPEAVEHADEEQYLDIVDEKPEVTLGQGSFENIVCIREGQYLNVRDQNLSPVSKTKLGEKVKVFGGWSADTKKKTIQGVTYTFVKTEFPEREASDERIGWVAQRFVQLKSKCKHMPNYNVVVYPRAEISGLDDPKCCVFPTQKKPTHPLNSGMRRFNAGRSSGKRLHAACDLYRYKNEPILSVALGKVISDRYYFYQGTYALEVRHSSGFIARYGEITGKAISGTSIGDEVTAGQKIAEMGKVNSNCCRPMLHFELYEGTGKGPLSTSTGKYKRRSDLLDPTNHLLKWEAERFE